MKKETDKMEKQSKSKKNETAEVPDAAACHDRNCPIHGCLSARGRSFRGYVKKIFNKRIVIEFDRIRYVPKYERYERKKTRIHAHLPDCAAGNVKVGDYVLVRECRPLSKIKHHVFISKISKEKEQ